MHASIHREKEQDSMSLMLKLIFLTHFQFADGQILLVSCACGSHLKMAWIKVSCVMLSWFGPGEATRCLLFFPPCPTSSRFCFNTSLSGIAVPFPLTSLICSVQFIHIASVEYVVSVVRILSFFKASQLDSVHS